MRSAVKTDLWASRPDIVARSESVFQSTNLAGVENLDGLVRRVAEIHGKPIEVHVTDDARLQSTTALWVDYPKMARIIVREIDSPLYRARGILHEAAHILFQHPGCNTARDHESVSEYVEEGGTVRGRMLATPHTTVLTADKTIEGEAEYLAHLLSRSLLQPAYISDERTFG
jgi:hypothetical protein